MSPSHVHKHTHTHTHGFQEKEIVLLPHSGQVLTPQLLKLTEINSVVATPAAAFSWVGAMGVLSPHCNPRQVCEASPGCGVTLPPGKGPTVPLIGPLVAERLPPVLALSQMEEMGHFCSLPLDFWTITRGDILQFVQVLPVSYIQYISWLRESPHHRMYL